MRERMKRFDQYMQYKGLNDNQVTVQCDLGQGLLHQARSGKSDLGSKTIKSILINYRDLNRVWLLTGEGNMLNQTDSMPVPVVYGEGNIRYWPDVSATGGSPEFLMNPDQHQVQMISVPQFGDCTDAVNIYGDSMRPLYKSGEVILLKAWEESFIEYGNVYLIITRNGNRMVKYLRKASTDDKVLCASENPSFDPFEINRSDILRLYQVAGAIRKDTN